MKLRHFISPSTYPVNSIFSVVVCIYKNRVFDEAFLLLAIVAMITEKMYFSYFHGNLCRRKIPSSNHVAYQSRQSLEKMESDWWSLLKKNRCKGMSCSPSLKSDTLVADSKWIFFLSFTNICYHVAQRIWFDLLLNMYWKTLRTTPLPPTYLIYGP